MNRHTLTFYGSPTASHHLKGHPIQAGSPRARISPPKSASIRRESEPTTRCKEPMDNLVFAAKKGERLSTTRVISRNEAQLDQVAQQDEPGTFSRQESADDERLFHSTCTSDRTFSTSTLITTSTLTASLRGSTSSVPADMSATLRSSTSSVPPSLPSSAPARRGSCNSLPPAFSSSMRSQSAFDVMPSRTVERRYSAPIPTGENQRRRRSSRKSVSGLGLVVEFDLDDESECTLFAGCDDYEENWRPELSRQDSKDSLEELRTRLEALEHERQQQQLPEHDESGLGEECVNKKFMEALESSSSSLHAMDGSYQSLISLRNSFAASQSGGASLLGIPEEVIDADEDEDVEQISLKAQRQSTPRLSIHGLVMEYDWSSASEGEEEEQDTTKEAATEEKQTHEVVA